jgi:hypothetical protein
MVTDAAGIDPCPGCDRHQRCATDHRHLTARVQAWLYTACRANWASTALNPQPCLDRLTAGIEQLGAPQSILRQVITLAGDAATLSDQEL